MNFLNVFKSECLRLIKNSDLKTMVFAAPILYAVLLSLAYTQGRVQEVPVGIVNEDSSAFTKNLLRQIDATEEVKITDAFSTIAEANQAMAREETYATLYIPRDFRNKQLHLRQSPIYLATNASNFAISSPPMLATSTVAQTYSAGTVYTLLRKAGLPKGKAQVMANPIALERRPIFNPLLNYSFFFVPGLIFAILQQIIIIGMCFSLTEQKDSKTWSPPRSHFISYIFGRALPYALINAAFAVLFIYTILPFINISSSLSQLGLLASLSFAFTLATSLMAFLFGLLFKDSVTAFIALMFYSMPAFLISGMSWPSYNLSWGLKAISWLTPITHFGDSVRRAILENQVSFRHVQETFVSLTIFAAIALGLSYLILKKQGVATTKN